MTRQYGRHTCPCGRMDAKKRLVDYNNCCGRYLEGAQTAPDAQTLMRSRYSAFVLEKADYLLATWHSSHRPDHVEFDDGVKWLGLQILRHASTDALYAEVTFVARQRDRSGRALRLHERSRFVVEAGRWYYVDGDSL